MKEYDMGSACLRNSYGWYSDIIKGYKEKEIEKQAEVAKKVIEESVEIERIREREMKILFKR